MQCNVLHRLLLIFNNSGNKFLASARVLSVSADTSRARSMTTRNRWPPTLTLIRSFHHFDERERESESGRVNERERGKVSQAGWMRERERDDIPSKRLSLPFKIRQLQSFGNRSVNEVVCYIFMLCIWLRIKPKGKKNSWFRCLLVLSMYHSSKHAHQMINQTLNDTFWSYVFIALWSKSDWKN